MFKKYLGLIHFYLCLYGVSLRHTVFALRGTPVYLHNYYKVLKLLKRSKEWRNSKVFPCLVDRYQQNGELKGHYFQQDLLVAQRIFNAKPKRHIDVGSRIDGFVAHVASYREIEVFDIRPLTINISNIIFKQMDCMGVLDEGYLSCTDSISCLHALEHFGLGRYGDNVDLDGYKKGLCNLAKLLEPNGILYLSVPIGEQRLEFDAHRIFDVKYLLQLFSEYALNLVDFSYIDDDGVLHTSVAIEDYFEAASCALRYGCGIFELRKIR